LVLKAWLKPQGPNVGLLRLEEVSVKEISVTSQCPSLKMLRFLLNELVQGCNSVNVFALRHTDFGECKKISFRGVIVYVAECHVCQVMYFVCKKEVDEVKVQLVRKLGVELLILGIDRLEVYDLHFELWSRSSEVFRDGTLRRDNAKISHLLDLGDREMLPREPRLP